jgi:hypothetical protein
MQVVQTLPSSGADRSGTARMVDHRPSRRKI